ncbi:uncharacterized protein LOC131224069 [Magnolia sinica]|uniref:uncharacterized protein LOC131224069 n=1 Tax=Magnolia sinica TaxID=86752 RepID=UPI0026580EF7|nr:uncharacterized protein LOC131224069 [Magnolia sinica]
MAICSIISAVNHPPPTPSNPSLIPSNSPKATQIPCNWRRQCFSGIASVIISTSTVGFSMGGESFFPASDPQVLAVTEGKMLRWSDKRTCPQWNRNSLENVVPENLPRPSGHWKSNEVAISRAARGIGCFSL